MSALDFLITNAGLVALLDVQNGGTAAVRIAEVGLTDLHFVMASTLTALPGEVAHINAVSTVGVDEETVHLAARDASTDSYEVRGVGLFLEDGTLFAVYSQADPIFGKSALSTFLLAVDLRFASGVVELMVFGDVGFSNPPAS